MTCPSTVVPRCYSDKRKSNVSDSVLFWISQAAICVTQFTVSVIKACAHFDFIWDGGKTQSFFFPPLSSDAVTDGEVCGASELVRPVFSLTHLGQWCMCASWHEPAHTHTHLYSHLVHSEVLRCLSHVFSDCVLSLERSFSHLMEKFSLGAVNLQKTNHHILCTLVTHAVFSFTAHCDNYWSISCHIVAFVHSPPPVFGGDCFCRFLSIRLSSVQDSSVEL